MEKKLGTVQCYSEYDYLALFDNIPETSLYHYTSLSTLLTILKNKKLRFSNRLYLNDSSEGRYVIKICLEKIDELWPNDSEYSKEEFKNELHRLEAHITNTQFNFFQMSLSLDEDSLTMWNYYAKGNGTNLKFSATPLINCLKAHLHNNTLGKLAFLHGRVVYDQAKQSEILKNLLSDFSKTKPFADEWYLFTSWAILNVGTLFKHPKFKDENEYRIAYNILSDIYSPNKCVSLFKDAAKNEPYYIEVYERENMLVPYIDVDFNPNIVEEICVSPRLSSEYTIDGLKLALMSNGFDVSKVKLKNSDIPLRF